MALNARSDVSFGTPPKCTVAPSDSTDLVNKDYVDKYVATAIAGVNTGGTSSSSTPTALTDSNGTYTASCPTLTDNTTVSVAGHTHESLQNIYGVAIYPPAIGGTGGYMIAQDAIFASYSESQTYEVGDVCSYQGELWQRRTTRGSGVAPSTAGMLWAKTTLSSMLSNGAGADKATTTVNGGNGVADMTGNPEVIIDNYPFFLGTIGLKLSNLTITGMMSVEVHLVYTSAGTRPSFKVQAGGDLEEVTWVRGSLSDLSTAGTHIVRLRMFQGSSTVTAEYVGKY